MCASSNWPLHNTLVCCCAIQLLGVESISMQLYIIYFNNAVVIGLLDACCCQRLRDVACQRVREPGLGGGHKHLLKKQEGGCLLAFVIVTLLL